MNIRWDKLSTVSPQDYKCGHCGSSVSPEKAYTGNNGRTKEGKKTAKIFICHKCSKPTFFDYANNQIPGPLIGNPVKHIPSKEVENLFDEAKACYSISAYTSSVMICRKLLMNISVSEGAKEGLSFAAYVNYLTDNNYIPPNGQEWVDSIRKLGNSANHKIEFNTPEEASRIITFTEMLLRFIYEMPGIMKESENE